MKFQDLAGDAFGIIANSLELGIDLYGRVNEAQMTRYRLLTDDEFKAEAINLFFKFVDGTVAQNDGVSELTIGFRQGFQASGEGLFAAPGHLLNIAANHVDVALQAGF